jgi:sugar O-acyltransferase (sialic acid O-acetyltransferase NeuD family)
LTRLLIFGASGHAAVAIDAALRQGGYEIVGLVGAGRSEPPVLGHPVLGSDDDLAAIVRSTRADAAFVAIGDNAVRQAVAGRATRAGLAFATLVHPLSSVAGSAAVAPGALVAAGAIVGPRAQIGAHAIVNTGAQLDHDCRLGDFASIAPAAVLGGDCAVEEGAAIGIGAVVIHGRRIGAHTVVGAGALVLHDLPAAVVAYGTPARVVRERQPGDKYL